MNDIKSDLINYAIEEGYITEGNSSKLGVITELFCEMCEPYFETYTEDIIYEAYDRVLENCIHQLEKILEDDDEEAKELITSAVNNAIKIYFNEEYDRDNEDEEYDLEYDNSYTR